MLFSSFENPPSHNPNLTGRSVRPPFHRRFCIGYFVNNSPAPEKAFVLNSRSKSLNLDLSTRRRENILSMCWGKVLFVAGGQKKTPTRKPSVSRRVVISSFTFNSRLSMFVKCCYFLGQQKGAKEILSTKCRP